MAKTALGRGLGALLGGSSAVPKPMPQVTPPPVPAPSGPGSDTQFIAAPDTRERVERVPLGQVHPCPFQPRKDFSADSIRELADSIKAQGIVQPLTVRVRVDGGYELIAGERRWRAAQLLGLADVPVLVRAATDRELIEQALVENLQRENLNPIEEAQGYAQLIEQFALTQEGVSTKVGKGRVVVANALRLLKLAPELQAYVRNGQLSVGHAKVILGLTGAESQKLAAERIIKDSLNVRQTEELVSRLQGTTASAPAKSGAKTAAPRDIHVADVEGKLQERYGTKVALRYRQGKGSVEIKFFSDDELDRILQISGVRLD